MMSYLAVLAALWLGWCARGQQDPPRFEVCVVDTVSLSTLDRIDRYNDQRVAGEITEEQFRDYLRDERWLEDMNRSRVIVRRLDRQAAPRTLPGFVGGKNACPTR